MHFRLSAKSGIAFILAAFCAGAASALPQASKIQVAEAEPTHIILALRDNLPRLDTLSLAEHRHLRIEFKDQTTDILIDSVAIPAIIVNIAIPSDARSVSAEVVSADWQEIASTLPLVPAIKLIRDSLLTRAQWPGPRQEPETWPPTVQVLDTGDFRDLRIARIQLVPLRQTAFGYAVLRNASIHVRWERDQRRSAAPKALRSLLPADLDAYKRLVINATQVQDFLRPRRPALEKSAIRAGTEYVKIFVDKNGIYKIDGASLGQNGVPVGSIATNDIRLYNNGGRPLPEKLSAARPDSLIEIPLLVEDGGDGRFDAADAIYFWGQSVNDWDFSPTKEAWQHYTNPYTLENVYWLSWHTLATPPKRLTPVNAGGSGAAQLTHGLQFAKVENDIRNPIHSGRQWFGTVLTTEEKSTTFTFNVAGQNPTAGKIIVRAASRTTGLHSINVYLNDNFLGVLSWFGRSGQEGYLYMVTREQEFNAANALRPGENAVRLEYSSSATFGSIFIDWVEFFVEDALTAREGTLDFAVPPGPQAATYSLSGFDGETYIMEVANPLAPRLMAFERQGSNLIFSDSLSPAGPRRYFASNQILAPLRIEPYTFSDLRTLPRGADMIIISHADFMEQAQRLAEHKEAVRDMRTFVVDIQTLFNEFSWGLVDPTAIRDFVRFTFQNWSPRPKFLVLFGDGDYDYRNILSDSDKNWIPPYQSADADTYIDQLESRAVEAYFTYVSGEDRIMDLAIGRLPVQTAQQARAVVDKIITYETSPPPGIWRTIVTMVGDDELVRGGKGNETFHIFDAESIAENYIPDHLNLRKIYLTEYRGVRTAEISGVRKPDAQEDLLKQLNDGTLIVNFVGHGNPQQWAHEKVFVQTEDYVKVQNGMRLPFFVAATCNFGEFDNPLSQSFTEDLINAEGRGAIALLTSSRVVYASSNARFNKQYYRELFRDNLDMRTVGEALQFARMVTNNTINDEKYTIIGDPSLLLAIPHNWLRVDSILPDSLIALSQTVVNGYVHDVANLRMPENGAFAAVVFDEPKPITYKTESGTTIRYILPGNLLFQGGGPVDNGDFQLQFIVPKDITYGGTNSRISLFGFGDNWEAIGYQERIPISLRSNLLFDTQGPKVRISFENQENFISGDPVPQDARLIAVLEDSISGINVTGEIGHKITLMLDGDVQSQIDLTKSFVYYPGSYLSGQIITPLPDLSPGYHSAQFKAWDNSNNSTKAFFDFVVVESGELQITGVMNYPNPFQNATNFTFVSSAEAEVKISIYTVAGRLIRVLDGITANPGFNRIAWDGLDEDGDRLANGVYFYKIKAESIFDSEGKTVEFLGKMAVQN